MRRIHAVPDRRFASSGISTLDVMEEAYTARAVAAFTPGVVIRSSRDGALDRLDGAEVVQERALAGRADAGDLVERVLHHLALALRPVRADGEAVRLVAQALDEVERRVARRQLERRLARLEEGLPAGVAVAALGDADDRHVAPTPSASSVRPRRLHLPLAAVDEDEVRPGGEFLRLPPLPLAGRGRRRGSRA